MTIEEFDEKWKDYVEPGFYGLAINDPDVIAYLDKEFTEEIKTNPTFTFSQIKVKFGKARVYTKSEKNYEWEEYIDEIIRDYD